MNLIAAALLAGSLFDAGNVRGRVVDDRGDAPIAGAVVRLGDTRSERTATSAADGAFTFGEVATGRYTLVVTRVGYDPVTVGVTVELGRDVEVDILLRRRPTEL